MRILLCLEDDYRTYREVIAACIQILRPHAEVLTAHLDWLEVEVRRYDPHLVICSLPSTAGYGNLLCWVELSLESSIQPTIVSIDGNYSEHDNPTLEKLLRLVDGVEQLI